jgi:hypothetical protein
MRIKEVLTCCLSLQSDQAISVIETKTLRESKYYEEINYINCYGIWIERKDGYGMERSISVKNSLHKKYSNSRFECANLNDVAFMLNLEKNIQEMFYKVLDNEEKHKVSICVRKEAIDFLLEKAGGEIEGESLFALANRVIIKTTPKEFVEYSHEQALKMDQQRQRQEKDQEQEE